MEVSSFVDASYVVNYGPRGLVRLAKKDHKGTADGLVKKRITAHMQKRSLSVDGSPSKQTEQGTSLGNGANALVPATSKAERPASAPQLSFEPGDRPERSYAHGRSLSTANKAAIDASLGRFMVEGDLVTDGTIELRTSSLKISNRKNSR
jgi:hypothetical protein